MTSDFAGTVVGGQKVCTSGGYKLMINFSKLFENTINGKNLRLKDFLKYEYFLQCGS